MLLFVFNGICVHFNRQSKDFAISNCITSMNRHWIQPLIFSVTHRRITECNQWTARVFFANSPQQNHRLLETSVELISYLFVCIRRFCEILVDLFLSENSQTAINLQNASRQKRRWTLENDTSSGEDGSLCCFNVSTISIWESISVLQSRNHESFMAQSSGFFFSFSALHKVCEGISTISQLFAVNDAD